MRQPQKVEADNDDNLLYGFEFNLIYYLLLLGSTVIHIFIINSMVINRSQASTMLPFGFPTDDSTMSKPLYKWRRVLLKVSGEALAGDHAQNIDPKVRM